MSYLVVIFLDMILPPKIDVIPREEAGTREEDKPADAKTLLRWKSIAVVISPLLSLFS